MKIEKRPDNDGFCSWPCKKDSVRFHSKIGWLCYDHFLAAERGEMPAKEQPQGSFNRYGDIPK